MLPAEVRYQKNGTFVRTLKFLHDENGAVIGISVKNAGETSFTSYYYAKNLQGDVVAIYRSDYNSTTQTYYPTLVASYEYDPWGKVIAVKGSAGTVLSLEAYPNHIAHVNPIRYRGYYYDNETGFYYLQSRYYDPVISRFINADSYSTTGQGFLGTNMFAYCLNNPVNHVDLDGTVSIWFYLLFINHDMGMVHRLVQETIKDKYGIDKERWVGMNIGKYFGRVDLLNGKTGEVWEIKHGKVKGSPAAIARIAEAQMQALMYIGAQTKEGTPVVKLGAAGAFSDCLTLPLGDYIYTVEYETPAPGCVLYYITKTELNWKKIKAKAAAAAAAAAAVSAVVVTGTTAGTTGTIIAGAPALAGSAGLGPGIGGTSGIMFLTGREGRWILEPF